MSRAFGRGTFTLMVCPPRTPGGTQIWNLVLPNWGSWICNFCPGSADIGSRTCARIIALLFAAIF